MQAGTAVVAPWARLRDVAALAKPRLSILVIVTAAAGIWVAPGDIAVTRALVTLVCVALIVGAANALNNYLERDVDALMTRTQNRPLPAGRLEPRVAVILAGSALAVGIPALALASNLLSATLSALATLLYAGVYTPLKRRSTWALPVGAVPGAIPPLIGWTAVTGSLDPGGLALFGMLFFWQLPHFLAISVYLREDYKRAGLQVFAAVHGVRAAKIGMVACILLLVPATLAVVPAGLVDPLYGVTAAILGAGLLGWSLSGLRTTAGVRWARGIFFATLGYLTLLMATLVIAAV